MDRYNRKPAKWQQRGKEEARMNKTELVHQGKVYLRGKATHQVKGGKYRKKVLRLLS